MHDETNPDPGGGPACGLSAHLLRTKQSLRYDHETKPESDPRVGQGVPAERPSEPLESDFPQPLRHYARSRSLHPPERLRETARHRRQRSVRRRERASRLYAQTLAERGFLTVAFDPSYTGESGGEPRYVASPDINTEDFSAAVDYLSTRDDVDPERIGILGICGFGGFAINAAAIDTRIKATVASTMYDISRCTANGYFDSMDADARYELRRQLNAQRTEDAKTGTCALAGGVVDPLPDDAPRFVKDYYAYYKTPRGYHPRSLNSNDGWNKTSSLSFINMPILSYSDEIRSAVLLIHGEKAHSRYFSEDAFKKLKGNNKELHIIPGASHVDLYDNLAVIPFDKIEGFFREYLK